MDDEDRKIEIAANETYIWIADENQLEKRERDFDDFVKEEMPRWVGSEAEPGCAIRPYYRGSVPFLVPLGHRPRWTH